MTYIQTQGDDVYTNSGGWWGHRVNNNKNDKF